MFRHMMKAGLLTVVVSLGATAVTHAEERAIGMPRDVADFVERAEECTFWVDAELFDGDEGDAELSDAEAPDSTAYGEGALSSH